MNNVKTLIFSLLMCCMLIPNDDALAARQTHISDAVITSQVKMQFAKDELVNPFDITVKTTNGKVKLEGLVNSYTEYERALVIANSTDGVDNIDSDNLYVRKSRQLITDTVITAKVKGQVIRKKLLTNKDLSLNRFNVETNNGHVYLSGVVNNSSQKNNLIKLAQRIKGVKDVDASSLRIRR